VYWSRSSSGKTLKGLTCVVVGRQRVKHTLEANKLRLKEGKDPLLVPGVVKRGSANQMAKYMVSENEIRRPDTPLGRAKKMSDALDRGLDEDDIACCLAAAFRPFAQRCPSSMPPRPSGVEAGTVTVTQARQLASLKPEEQREKVSEIERQPLAQPAMKKPGVSVRSSVMQSRV
jgi:ParB family chromosome partitioning protein